MKKQSVGSRKVVEIRQEIQNAMPIVKDRFKQAGEIVQESVRKVIPQKDDNPETRYFKILGLTLIGLVLIAILAGVASFLLTLRSPEAIAVPAVVGSELADGIDSLQEFGLIAHVEQRFFSDPATKNKIMDQSPEAGASVRVGREITIVVSKGASVDKVGNYVGRDINDVSDEIHTQFIGDNPALQIGTVSYAFDQSEAGTILSQDPPPGTDLGKRIQLSFLVSRGKDASLREVPDLVGTPYAQAIQNLEDSQIPFQVVLSTASTQAPGTIVDQNPAGGQNLDNGAALSISMTAPASIPAGQAFGVYSYTMPAYTAPVDITISALSPSGTMVSLYSFKSYGGLISVPYLVDDGSEIVLTAFTRELDRKTVHK